MAIDYVINYDCVPKQKLGTERILELLKGRERANTIIKLFRENGDDRPPSQMGFEFTRTTPEGEDQTVLVVVQDLLDDASDLNPLEPHCRLCPANRTGTPFGCTGFIQYPISGAGEAWLLNQLPSINEPLIWLLLKQGVDNFQYDGQRVAYLRQHHDSYFEDKIAPSRFLGEFNLNANQIFEMMFMVGDIIPNHAAILLLFYNALDRADLEAHQIMALTPATEDKIRSFPFLHQIMQGDDLTTMEFKEFFHALWVAWALNVNLMVDS